MIEAICIGLLLGVCCVLLDSVAQWSSTEPVDEWVELARGIVAGSFVFGPPVILAWCTTQAVEWVLAVIATWAVMAVSRRDLRDWAREVMSP